MTAQLQLTDTDYPRSFKALCQERMATLRRAGQQALLKDGCRDVWQASVEDCVVAVVAAQSEMSLRQTQNDWIVAGLRRNGMLSYKPDFKSREMKPLKDEPAADYAQGSARYPSEWLQDRYSWVTKESGKMVPVQPDWSLIPGFKEIADLVEYQYTSEDQALLNLEELPEALRWPCVESGLLQIPLGLQKVAWKLDSAKSKDVKNKLKQKSLAKELRSKAKQVLAGKFQQRVAAQLKQMSLKQAASRITPMAGISAAKGRSL